MDENLMVKNNLKENVEKFIKYLQASQATAEAYTKNLRQFSKYLNENNITEPTREDILNFKTHLQTYLKPTTVSNYIMAVRQFFKWLAQEGLYKNIAENIKPIKLDNDFKRDNFTLDQLEEIAKKFDTKTIRGKRDYAIFALMFTGGLRTIEVERANIEDIRNVGTHTVMYIQGKGKNEKTQFFKLTKQTEKILRNYLATRQNYKKEDPLFVSLSHNNVNGRMTTRSLRRLLKDYFVEAGFDDERLTAHSIRHSTATINLTRGGTLQETKDLLRHRDINTTMIYAHNLDKLDSKSEERLANAMIWPGDDD